MSISVAAARQKLRRVVDKAEHHKARIVLTRHGRAVAAVVPMEDVRFLRRIEDAIDLKAARRAIKEPTVSLKQARKLLGL